jgi:ATP:ADP antiporter, AAA family
MRDKLGTLPGIESGEESKVSMLLIQSVFLGIFIGAFDVTAYSLFLSYFDEKMMARGFMISGVLAILSVFLCQFLKKQAGDKLYPVLYLLVLSILTLCLWAAVLLSPAKEIVFLFFVFTGPVNLLVLEGLHNLKKQRSVLISTEKRPAETDMWFIPGILLISLLIPILTYFKFQLIHILLLGEVFISSAAVLQLFNGNVAAKSFSGRGMGNVETDISKLAPGKDPYVRTIGLYTLLSVLSAYFIQYLFLAVVRQQFPAAENMALFLGLFTAGLMILIIVVRAWVFRLILHFYGLLVCLVIIPSLVTIFTLLAIAEGSITGYAPATGEGFILFLISLAVIQLVYWSLAGSVGIPSLRIIYQTLEERQFTADPVLKNSLSYELLAVISGLILTVTGLISSVTLLHFAIFLLALSLLWFYIGIKLFRQYKKSIAEATERSRLLTREVDSREGISGLKGRFSAHLALRRDYFRLVSGDFSVLDTTRNNNYYEEIIDFAVSRNDVNLLPVLKRFSNSSDIDQTIRFRAAAASKVIQENQMTIQPEDEKIRNAMRTLSGTRKPLTTEILRLFRDNSIESKRLALCMIGKFGLTDLMTEVCESLATPGLTIDASEVLKSFGPGVEDELIRYFLIKAGNPKLSRTILPIIGKNCTEGNKGFIFSRLWANSRQMKEMAVKGLLKCDFKPNDEEKQRLTQLTSEVIGTITWYLSAKVALERDNNSFLLERIKKEISRWNIFLFDILSITYGSGVISRIFENINSGTIESINFALEMIDLIVSDTIKLKLIYLLDSIPDEDKLVNMFQFYPGEIPNARRLQEEIINRDYNLISLWTKACVLRSIAATDSDDMAESVTALLFSPEELIQEEAASLIARSDPDIYRSVSERLPDSVRKHLEGIVSGTTNKMEYLFEKVKFLSANFKGIEEDELLPLAAEMTYLSKIVPGSLNIQGGAIAWIISPDGDNPEVLILLDGKIDNLNKTDQQHPGDSAYYLPASAVEEYHFQSPEKSEEILRYIDDCEQLLKSSVKN